MHSFVDLTHLRFTRNKGTVINIHRCINKYLGIYLGYVNIYMTMKNSSFNTTYVLIFINSLHNYYIPSTHSFNFHILGRFIPHVAHHFTNLFEIFHVGIRINVYIKKSLQIYMDKNSNSLI